MKLVSVITPTHNRHDLLLNRCMPSVQKQTYSEVEHIIYSDVLDEELKEKITSLNLPNVIYAHGQTHNREVPREANAANARNNALNMAKGEYIAYLDDDDEYLPEHISSLVKLLEDQNYDFVFSKMKRYWKHPNGENARDPDVVGDGTVLHGHIGTPMVLHKKELLQKKTWFADEQNEDFTLYRSWLELGCKFAFLDKETIIYHKTV